MILGFTGTRKGMSQAQQDKLSTVVSCLPEKLIHGGAEGADTQFHDFMHRSGMFPEDVEVYALFHTRDYWQSRKVILHGPYDALWRNRLIASRCDALLACPNGEEILRSGTWSTIRYTRLVGKPITFIMPDGNVLEELAHPFDPFDLMNL